MRPKPCWSDSLGLEILAGWVVAVIVAAGLLLLSECAILPAHAWAYKAMGVTWFVVRIPFG